MSELSWAWNLCGESVAPESCFGKKGVFTTFGMIGNDASAYEIHRNRLLSDAQKLGIQVLDFRVLNSHLKYCLRNCRRILPYKKRIRISLTESSIQIDISRFIKRPRQVWARIEPYSRRPYAVKSLDYLELSKMQRRDGPYWETLLLDPDFGLAEGRSTNLIFGTGDLVLVPEAGFLPGLGLQRALDVLGNCVVRQKLTLDDLLHCKEIVCLNHLQGPMQIIAIPDYNWQSSSSQIYNRLRRLLGTDFSWW